MPFTTLSYLAFLAVAILLYYVCPPKGKNFVLLIISFLFYGIYNWKLVPFLCIFSLAVYGMGILLERHRTGSGIFVCVVIGLLPLLFCKYFGFLMGLMGNSWELLGKLGQRFSFVLPLGISYFTFKSIGYLIDVYKGKIEAEKNVIDLCLFITFFPEMLIGPIDRTENLLAQIREKGNRFRWENLKIGACMLLYGYFTKLVVADRIGIIVDTVYSDLYAYSGFTVLIAVILYSFQIYFDFAGCTYLARGTGKMLGFSLPENFRQPYLAVSVADFWRRWHISLTSWLREYIYFPLGGNRKGILRKHMNVLIVFLISGIWHGAGVSFVVWGFLNGAFQVLGTVCKPLREKIYIVLKMDESSALCVWWKRFCTFSLMTAAWIFFRADGMHQALLVFKKIFAEWNPWVFWDGSLYELGLSQRNWILMMLLIAVMIVIDLLRARGCRLYFWFTQRHSVTKSIILYIILFSIIVFGIYGSAYDSAAFIYMQF